jgi:GT2 family glycosyltransferase
LHTEGNLATASHPSPPTRTGPGSFSFQPKLDIVVPTADRTKFPCSESIPWNLRSLGYNGENVRVLTIESSGPGFGFAKSVNVGLRKARRDASVLLLNDDCFLDRSWLLPLFSTVRCHPRAIYGGLLRFPPDDWNGPRGNVYHGRRALNHWGGEYQHAGGFIPITPYENTKALFRFAVWHMAPLWVLRQIPAILRGDGLRFPGHFHNLDPRNRFNLVTAAAMLLTPEVREELGEFDEDYPVAFEDTDYCLRALEFGMDIVLSTYLSGVHYEGVTMSKHQDRIRESYRVFTRKWWPARIKSAVGTKRGIVHPDFCSCGSWVE